MLFILHCLSGSCLASLTKILSACPSPPQLLDFSSAKILKLKSPEMATSEAPTQAYWIKHPGPGDQRPVRNESFRASERQLGVRTSVQFPGSYWAPYPLPTPCLILLPHPFYLKTSPSHPERRKESQRSHWGWRGGEVHYWEPEKGQWEGGNRWCHHAPDETWKIPDSSHLPL